jgi:glutamate-ammonia-ligase adenylyltransferase
MSPLLPSLAALGYSRYATQALAAHPEDAHWLDSACATPFDWTAADALLADAAAAGDAVALAAALRGLRRRVYLHTMLRDLDGVAGLDEVCGNMTRLACAGIDAAVTLHHRALADVHGEPRDDAGAPQELVVIGMGKLGGGELNVSSDIDLVFVYPSDGSTDGARALANREFFDRLGRRVIGALNDVTEDGFVFRVDMRLRPYGESGPLTVPFAALEEYLITQGRTWERYAWLKARPLTGGHHDEVVNLITPFVFRKYLDFDAYEGLRDVHRQIRTQGKRRDYAGDVKLGPGGIREIEFIAQALQLVRGGREPALRVRGTQQALAAIGARGLLPGSTTADLQRAYVFLRNVEHRLQYRDDRQTQLIPVDSGELDTLAHAAAFESASAFAAMLDRERRNVATQFAALFGDGDHEGASAGAQDGATKDALAALWRGDIAPDSAHELLAAQGFADPARLAADLARVRSGARYGQLPALSRQRIDLLVPDLLAAAAATRVDGADAQTIFGRLLNLLESISRRSAYLALLAEHPPVVPRLAQLAGASAWAADYLTRHPMLLDELLDARVLLEEADWDAWRRELAQWLASHAGDPERQMDALRHFQHAHSFRLLAQDLAGLLTVERLADHLSALADIIIAATLAEVWKQVGGTDAAPPRFAVIGYGKLGGKELGYASDLDLVFLYDDADEAAQMRYTRYGQRVVTWLTAITGAGALYATDLRLRPDGDAGVLVASFAGFCRYERDQAWTWEHQALTRARFVAGDAGIGTAFEAERESILRLTRDRARLHADVTAMRERMAAGHPNRTALFDLKHDVGGMVDVEFAVQYLVLAHAHDHPPLTRNAGNIALLGVAADLGLVPAPVAALAGDAYRDFRRLQHQIRLTGAAHAQVAPEPEEARRHAVVALWTHVFGAPRAAEFAPAPIESGTG